MKFPTPRIETICEKTRKQFTRLLPLAGLVVALLGFTAASPIGRRPIGVSVTPTLGSYPATSIPLSGNTTVTPDTPPTDTANINVSTSTDFKGTLEGNSITGVVQVTDAHPAGTYIVTVKAFSSTADSTTATFNLTVSTPETCNPVSFGAPINFGVGDRTVSVAVGDFNGDGKQDLAVVNSPTNIPGTVSILLGNGAGRFSTASNLGGVGASLLAVLAVGDFNGDGKQDLAVENSSFTVAILLGDGAGSFSGPTSFGVGNFPYGIAVGDFNRDGRQDLAVANGESDNVSILLGNGIGGFSAATNFSVGNLPFRVEVGDFNGDGKQDLAVLNASPPTSVSILLGNGMGAFNPATNFSVGDSPLSMAVGDFNDDGKQDLAVTNEFSDSVLILLGNGIGGFSIPTSFDAGGVPDSVAVGDFNGDGKQDLAVTISLSFNMSILLGDGFGGFSAPMKFGVGDGVFSHPMAVGDFNGDGKQDLAVATPSNNNVSILLRVCPSDQCTVCHKHTTTLTLPCNSVELVRHLAHGDTEGACPSN